MGEHKMRRFVVLGHRAITSSNFNLNDLCGSTGRLDVLLRCINSAFFLSHDFRRDVELYLVLLGEPNPPKTLRLVGDELKYLNPDERSTGALIRNALMKKLDDKEIMSTPGIYVSKSGFEEVLNKLSKISKIVYLKEDGKEFTPKKPTQDYTFILSDDKDMGEEEEKLIQKYEAEIISLGQKSYHSDHCIILVNNILDKIDKNNP
jgi:tRNA (pseudouridine54-N1)-methyltransferase